MTTMEITPEVDKFNTQGVDALTDEEVLIVGDIVSARLVALQLPGLDSSDAIEGDTAYASAIETFAPVSTLTITTKGGAERSIELRGDSGIGKSGAPTTLRIGIASRVGLEVNSENPDDVRRFVALATRYAASLQAGR